MSDFKHGWGQCSRWTDLDILSVVLVAWLIFWPMERAVAIEAKVGR